MKYVILHGQGYAGPPCDDLGGLTALQAAATPGLDRLPRAGEFGLAVMAAEDGAPGGDLSSLALLGYDPRKYHSGPAPFEAAGLGVALGEHDVAYRCDMVTLRSQAQPGVGQGGGVGWEVKKLGPHVVMEDATVGGIESEEARELIDAVNEQLGSESLQFYPGSRHRHVMVWVDGKARAVCVDPERVVGRPIEKFLPSGDGADMLRQVMEASLIILRDHPVNGDRRGAGLKPANCLWLWGQGRAHHLPKLTDRYRITGAVVSASDLHRGIGICAGLEGVVPETAAGGGEGPGPAEAALRELGKRDFAYLHVEAPTEIARGADAKAKVKAVEEFDRSVIGPLLDGLARLGPHRLLVMLSPAMPAESDTGTTCSAPYAIYQSAGAQGADTDSAAGPRRLTEAEAAQTQVVVRDATRLVGKLLGRS